MKDYINNTPKQRKPKATKSAFVTVTLFVVSQLIMFALLFMMVSAKANPEQITPGFVAFGITLFVIGFLAFRAVWPRKA